MTLEEINCTALYCTALYCSEVKSGKASLRRYTTLKCYYFHGNFRQHGNLLCEDYDIPLFQKKKEFIQTATDIVSR
jgi:hypothetical protein